jgi:hypothetical protein
VKPPLLLKGMHGLGDNLHQRGLLPQLMDQHEVYLESSWVSLYWDLIQKGLHVIYKPSTLRTMAKNAFRERELFTDTSAPINAKQLQIWWRAQDIRTEGSVMAAMCLRLSLDPQKADFRLPIHPDWDRVLPYIMDWTSKKPHLIYRPLVIRKEWSVTASQTRNPNHEAYRKLFKVLRPHFFVVSIADLKEDEEWLADPEGFEEVAPDIVLHKGELPFEQLAALWHAAALVYCSPGFGIVLAQAVGTPVICVHGGYENSRSFSHGSKYAPTLCVDPIKPCDCFLHGCKKCGQKLIDISKATTRIERFLDVAVFPNPSIRRRLTQTSTQLEPKAVTPHDPTSPTSPTTNNSSP